MDNPIRATARKNYTNFYILYIIMARKKMYRKNKLAKVVKKLIDGKKELMYYVQGPSTLTADNTPTLADSHLTAVAQGDGASDRSGLTIHPKSLYFKCNVKSTATYTAEQRAFVRIVIARQNYTINDTGPNITDIYTSANVLAQKDLSVSPNRFTILYDKLVNLQSDTKPYISLEFYKKLNGVMRWNGSGAADYQNGQIFLWVYSDVATTYPEVDYSCTFRYID